MGHYQIRRRQFGKLLPHVNGKIVKSLTKKKSRLIDQTAFLKTTNSMNELLDSCPFRHIADKTVQTFFEK
jgi:hypothetical protein